MINKQHLKSQNQDYALGKFKISGDKEIKCYTKRQMHSLYPKKNYEFIGEYKNENSKDKEDCIGNISVEDISLNLNEYKHNNRLFYKEKGYLQCDDNSFVVLLKKVFIKRILITLLSIVLIAGTLYAFFGRSKFSNNVRDLFNLDPNATDWDENYLPPNEPSPSTKISGFSTMTIPENATNINVSLGNSTENDCYFIISLYLEDNTLLFKSELIPPGKGLYNITLSKPLSKGEYNAILRYQTYNLTTQQEMNSADLDIKIISK